MVGGGADGGGGWETGGGLNPPLRLFGLAMAPRSVNHRPKSLNGINSLLLG